MTWLNSLKIAIIEEDITKIGTLTKELPNYDSKQEAEEALALIGEAIKLVDSKKQKTLEAMKKIKQTKVFLESH
ncbi:MAG TPA: hypothetical protein EYG93_01495 [Sulfurospirillum arcachonense]|nr:hypothetical protein [Sulfurospirillum arcachonense]HIP43995.1 hypothetical protein [Sulfurospirillum arcachonense]